MQYHLYKKVETKDVGLGSSCCSCNIVSAAALFLLLYRLLLWLVLTDVSL